MFTDGRTDGLTDGRRTDASFTAISTKPFGRGITRPQTVQHDAWMYDEQLLRPVPVRQYFSHTGMVGG